MLGWRKFGRGRPAEVSQERTAERDRGGMSEEPWRAPTRPPAMQAFVSESPPLKKKKSEKMKGGMKGKGKEKCRPTQNSRERFMIRFPI